MHRADQEKYSRPEQTVALRPLTLRTRCRTEQKVRRYEEIKKGFGVMFW